METLPDAGRRPAMLSVLALALAAWMAVPLRVLLPGAELELGFTANNVIFVLEAAAITATVVLAAGAAALRARRLLIAAVVVSGLHLVFELVTAAVQLMLGARSDLLFGSLIAICVLAVVTTGVVLGLVLQSPRRARWIGLTVVLVGALIHNLLINVMLPIITLLSYGSINPAMGGSLVVTVVLNLLVIAAVALCGWAAPVTRRIGALLAAVVGVLGIIASAGAIGALGGAYAAVQILEALLMLAGVVLAVLAARATSASSSGSPRVPRPGESASR